MFREDGNRPNDQRGFVHKRIFGAAKGFVSGVISGGPLAGVRGAVAGLVRSPARATRPRGERARPSILGEQEKELGRNIKFISSTVNGPPRVPGFTPAPRFITTQPRRIAPPPAFGGGGRSADDCPSGTIPDPQGRGFCVSPRSTFGRGAGAESAPVGDAVMGRYGAALEPGVMLIERSVCLPGMQLGDDGLCYNKGQITNKQRAWPRGRKPLLTGGEMRAIGIASRAGRRVDATAKRLRELGMMKQLPRSKAKPHAHAKAATGVVSV